MKGADPGLAMHAAKIIECSSLAATPGGRDAILATIREDHFEIESMNPARRCTPVSVAAHSLYEQPNPYEVVEPGGRLDMTQSVFEAIDTRRTRVSGSRWEVNPDYTIKLEGVEAVGHRCFSFGAIRCPIATGQIEAILDAVKAMVGDLLKTDIAESDYRLKFRTYGLDGAMGSGETATDAAPHEITVVTDVIGRTEDIARSVCSVARYNLLHYFYDGILATGGNIAIPFVPSDISLGTAYEFSIYHLISVADPLALFPMEVTDIRNGDRLDQAA
jgi:hypothetical protein